VSKDPKYIAYMDREWRVTSDLLWDPQDHLFYRDKSYLAMKEKNGQKVFWSRGNGWVMGGLVGVLQHMRKDDPRRAFYIKKLQEMAESVSKIQGQDGLWRAGLFDPSAYVNPEISGSAFFVYAITWGISHGLLRADRFLPVVEDGWQGIVNHIYADGRLGDIQPVGEAPGAYTPSSSYVFGIGAFLLAASELDMWLQSTPERGRYTGAVEH
jgi:rhamnogalacturonyl hydrolase YesR